MNGTLGRWLLTGALALSVADVAAAAEAPAAAKVPDVAPEIAGLVDKIQRFYEATRGLDTAFTQRFTAAGVPSRFGESGAKGRLRFGKPAGDAGPFMRWDYDDGRILLLVKETSYSYDPDTRQAISYENVTKNLSAAVSFLWGKGRLADEFTIAKAERADLGVGVALELTPKKAGQGFTKVFLLADPETGLVRASAVVQTNGSENRLTFVEPKSLPGVAAADFDPAKVFPPGTAIQKGAVPGVK